VNIIVGDGSQGWPDVAPFDAIIVAAAAPRVPSALFEQLAENGRMVIPVGPPEAQELLLIRKLNGRSLSQRLEGCRFVPLIGAQGYIG
jgi:protein-L-isoaspartate(D-aspartate) O-methyltransferase